MKRWLLSFVLGFALGGVSLGAHHSIAAVYDSSKRVTVDFYAVHHNYPSLNYYGSGPGSDRNGRSNYRMEDTAARKFRRGPTHPKRTRSSDHREKTAARSRPPAFG